MPAVSFLWLRPPHPPSPPPPSLPPPPLLLLCLSSRQAQEAQLFTSLLGQVEEISLSPKSGPSDLAQHRRLLDHLHHPDPLWTHTHTPCVFHTYVLGGRPHTHTHTHMHTHLYSGMWLRCTYPHFSPLPFLLPFLLPSSFSPFLFHLISPLLSITFLLYSIPVSSCSCLFSSAFS